MQIHGLNKTTLLDYPHHLAATIFCGGCNFRCPFCHNADLVLDSNSQPLIPPEEVISFLMKRKGILEGVCMTGGEPTLQKDLIPFLMKIKELGYLIKLDTNGYQPSIIEELLRLSLLDYIAMDIKSSKEAYSDIANIDHFDIKHVITSVKMIQNSNISYEFRTTVVRELHDKTTMTQIAQWLDGSTNYYLQNYEESDRVLKKGFHSYSKEELSSFIPLFQGKIENCSLRGID